MLPAGILDQIERGIVRGRVISLPAIAEDSDPLGRAPGEYLWDDPDGWNYGEFLRSRHRETSPMMWAALYQQRLAPEEAITSRPHGSSLTTKPRLPRR
jgi:hypothetical protein